MIETILTNSIYEVVAVIVSTLFFSSLFYSAFKLKWPEIYFSANDKFALFITTSSWRYIYFRLLPILIIITFSCSVFLKGAVLTNILFGGFLSGMIYSLFTDGVAIVKILFKSDSIKIFFNRYNQIFLHIVSIIICGLIGLLSGWFSSFVLVQALVPSPQGLVDNVWSAIIVAIGVIYITNIFKPVDMEIEKVFQKSRELLNKNLINSIKKYSQKFNANSTLVEAICITENIQRPKWVRKIERVISRFKTNGTYGIMQVKSCKPLSDIESIELSIKEYHKDTKLLKNYQEIYNHIKKYNKNNEYIDLVVKTMEYLDYDSIKY